MYEVRIGGVGILETNGGAIVSRNSAETRTISNGGRSVDGYNVFATTDGVYKGSKWNKDADHNFGLGFYASMKDSDGSWRNFGHLDPKSAPDLKKGDPIKKGDYIGRIANPSNGNTSGPHVHVEKWSADNAGKNTINSDPGSDNPLGSAGKENAGYPNYNDGNFHGGRDFGPKEEFRVTPKKNE